MNGTILGLADTYQSQASQALGSAANMRQARNEAYEQMKDQSKLGVIGNVASGAGTGFAVGGPVGAGIGAGLGMLASFF